jgi:site-specific DNA-cytosine methylase
MRVAELCSGIGGLRAGLELAGARTVFSCDNDVWAVAAQNRSFGPLAVQAECTDVSEVNGRRIAACDVLAAGFPCQPFSSSGSRKGFSHSSGNVFEQVLRIAREATVPVLFLENVQGLLSNQGGFTFAECLRQLLATGYNVQWRVVNALDLGVAQNRPRLLIHASAIDGPVRARPVPDGWETHALEELLVRLTPRVGKRLDLHAFGPVGFADARSGAVSSGRPAPACKSPRIGAALVSLIYGESSSALPTPSSVRFWGHSGKTKPYFRAGSSHCVGTNIGAAPLFAVPQAVSAAVTVDYNWSRLHEDWFIFRLTPVAALPVFGDEARMFEAGLCPIKSQVRGYRLLGNMVAPRVAQVFMNFERESTLGAAS